MGNPNQSLHRNVSRRRWRWNRSRVAEWCAIGAGTTLGAIIAASAEFPSTTYVWAFVISWPLVVLIIGVLARKLAEHDDGPS